LQQFKLGHYWPIPTLDNDDSPCLPYTQEHKLHHRIGCASIEFKQHFPNATIIELQHNYRCVSNVVDLSNDLIGHAGYPFKPTQSVRDKGKIDFLGCFIDDNEEAAAIVEEIGSGWGNRLTGCGEFSCRQSHTHRKETAAVGRPAACD
jgi:hypothetical protein